MNKKILVIDDEPEMTELLKSRLESQSYEIITAHDGEEGLEKARYEKPDLIILDVLMPKMDGYTFVRELKVEEATKGIPVIVLTAKRRMQDLFKLEGIHDYILK